MSKKKSSQGRKTVSRSKGAAEQHDRVEEVEYSAQAAGSAACMEELPESVAGISIKALGKMLPSIVFPTVAARRAAVEANLGDRQTLRDFLQQVV